MWKIVNQWKNDVPKKRILIGIFISILLAFATANDEGSNLQGRVRSFQCNKDGWFRDPYNCTLFYRCADLTGEGYRFQLFRFDCPPGTVYDDNVNICNHPQLVDSCAGWFTKGIIRGSSKPNSGQPAATQKPPIGIPVHGSQPVPISVNAAGAPGTDVPKPVSPSVPTSIANQRCQTAGLFRSPDDCRRFHICVDVFGNGTTFQLCEYPCPDGTVFSNLLAICTTPSNAEPCITTTVTTAKPSVTSSKPTGSSVPPVVTTKPTTSRPTIPPVTFRCTAAGYFRHPYDCSRYYQCVNLTEDGRVFQRYEFVCGQGSVFDESVKVCNHPSAVPGCSEFVFTTPNPTGSTFRPSIGPPTSQKPVTMKPTTQVPHPSTAPPGVSSTTKYPITPPGPAIAGSECKMSGLFANPKNCSHFYQCVNLTVANDRFHRYDYVCGLGTVFDPSIGVCNHAGAVANCGGFIISTPKSTTSNTPYPSVVTQSSTSGRPWVTVPTISTVTQTIPTATQVEVTSTIVIPISSTSKPPSVTIPAPVIAGPECPAAGHFRNPTDCSKFFRCVNTTIKNDIFLRYDFTCGQATVFDPTIGVCNHPNAVPGCEGFIAPSPSSTPQPRPLPSTTAPEVSSSSKPTISTTAKPISTLIPPTMAGSECKMAGFFSNPHNCAWFFQCVNTTAANDKFIRYDLTCGVGTVFDQTIGVCNHPSAVPGCEGFTIPVPVSTVGPLPETSSQPQPITSRPTISPLPPISTLPSPVIAGQECSKAGLFRNPSDCARFFRCVNLTSANDRFVRYDFTCGLGSVFDPSIGVCNHPSAVLGCESYVVPIPSTTVSPGPGQTTSAMPEPKPTSTFAPISTLPTPVIAGQECSKAGLFRNPNDCARFFRCVNLTSANDRFIRYDFICGLGSVFDPSVGVCNHPSAVPGCEGYVAPVPVSTASPEPGQSSSALPVTMPTSTSPSISTLPTPVIAGQECSKAGLFRNPNDCARFFRCVNLTSANDRFIRYDFICGLGSVFDPSVGVCNHPSAVPGCEGYVAPVPISTASPEPGQSSTAMPVTIPTSISPPIPTLPTPVIAGQECSKAGLFRNPNDCARFFRCVNLTSANDRFIRYDFICGLGSVFDPSVGVCNHPSAVPGCEGYVAPVPVSTASPEPGQSSSALPVTMPTSTSPSISTLPTPVIAGQECSKAGLFRNPNDCARFFRCVNLTSANDRFIRYDFICGLGSVFDPSVGVCNHPSAVPGCEGYVAPVPVSTASPEPGQSSSALPVTMPTSTSPSISTLPTPVIAGQECSKAGLYRNPNDCARFFRCVNLTSANDRFIRYEFICGLGSVFDPSIGVCNHPSAVLGCEGYVVPVPISTASPRPGQSSTVLPVTMPTSTLPPISTLPAPVIAGQECSKAGLFRNQNDCSKFYQCVNLTNANDRFIRYDFICGLGSVFDPSIGVCNHPSGVPGCEGYVVPVPISTASPEPGQSSTALPVTIPTSTSPPISTLPTPVIPGQECSKAGLFRNPNDCARFFRCVNLTSANDRFIRYDFICGLGSVFDPSIGVCNHPSAVPGCEGYVAPVPISTVFPEPGQSSTALPVPIPTSTSPPISTLPTPVIAGQECSKAGLFRNPNDCARFYRCVNLTSANDRFIRYDFICGLGSVFDQSIGVCNHPSAVPGCEGYVAPVPISTASPEPGKSSTALPVTTPTSTLPPISTLPTPVIAGQECSKAGLFRNPNDCARFYRCVNLTSANDRFIRYDFICGLGSVFDQSVGVCNHPSAVQGCEGYVAPVPISTASPEPGQSSTALPVTKPTSTLPPISTLPTPVFAGQECFKAGLFHNPNDCARFFRCVNLTSANDRFIRYDFICGLGSVFDPSIGVCNHPSAVPGCENHIIVTPTTPSLGSTITSISSSTINPIPVTSGSITESSTVTIIPIIPTPEGIGSTCTQDGFFRHVNDCSRFFRCVYNNKTNGYAKFEFVCGSGSVFDLAINVCNHPSAVSGCEGYIPSPTPPCAKTDVTTQSSISSQTASPTTSPSVVTTSTMKGDSFMTLHTSHAIQTTSQISEVTVTSAPKPVSTPPPGNTVKPNPLPTCIAEGLFRNPQNCSKFYRCVDLTGKGVKFQIIGFNCPPGTYFDEGIRTCNHRHLVACSNVPAGGVTDITSSTAASSFGSSTVSSIGSSTTTGISLITGSSTSSSTTSGSGTSIHESGSSSTVSGIISTTPGSSSTSKTTSGGIISSTLSGIGPSTPSSISTTTPSGILSSTTARGSTGLGFQCNKGGKFEHRFNCSKFYLCQDLLGNGKRFHLCEVVCPQEMYFDKRSGFCSNDVTLAYSCIDRNSEEQPSDSLESMESFESLYNN